MARIYLIEGADGAGKTSFVQRASSRLWRAHVRETLHNLNIPLLAPPRIIHNGPEDASLPGSLFQHYRAQLLDAISFREQGITTFIDRSYLSEQIYGRLFRGKSRISERQVRRLDRLAAKAGVIMLGFEAVDDVRRARIEARGETWGRKQYLIAARYYIHFREPNSSWHTVDSTSTLPQQEEL